MLNPRPAIRLPVNWPVDDRAAEGSPITNGLAFTYTYNSTQTAYNHKIIINSSANYLTSFSRPHFTQAHFQIDFLNIPPVGDLLAGHNITFLTVT